MTCDGRDIIATDFALPNLEVGDWLVFGGMGAYTFGPKSEFNGMKATSKVEVWSENKVVKKLKIKEGKPVV